MNNDVDSKSAARRREDASIVAALTTLSLIVGFAVATSLVLPAGWPEWASIVLFGFAGGFGAPRFHRWLLRRMTRNLPADPDPRASWVRSFAWIWLWLVVLTFSIFLAQMQPGPGLSALALLGMIASLIMISVLVGPGVLDRTGQDAKRIFDELWLENSRRAASVSLGAALILGSALLFCFALEWISLSGMSVTLIMMAGLVLSFLGAQVWFEWRSED